MCARVRLCLCPSVSVNFCAFEDCDCTFSLQVVCGTQSGALSIFKWGDWGDVSDRFPGHPQSVESMVKVDEGTLITCSEDGIIRIVSIQPNKLLVR